MYYIFTIGIEDAQDIARKRIGRELTDDELYTVKKCVGFGLECWEDVVTYAIKYAITEQ